MFNEKENARLSHRLVKTIKEKLILGACVTTEFKFRNSSIVIEIPIKKMVCITLGATCSNFCRDDNWKLKMVSTFFRHNNKRKRKRKNFKIEPIFLKEHE